MSWAKCNECGGEVWFDAWVDLNGDLAQGPFQNTHCENCEGEASYTVVEGKPLDADDQDEEQQPVAATKKWDVFMESFVCVELPSDVDPDSEEGTALLYRKAEELYAERLRTGQCEFAWEEFHE